MDILERRELNTGIWDAIVWDYTSVLFSLASLLQDFAPLSIKVMLVKLIYFLGLFEFYSRLFFFKFSHVKKWSLR